MCVTAFGSAGHNCRCSIKLFLASADESFDLVIDFRFLGCFGVDCVGCRTPIDLFRSTVASFNLELFFRPPNCLNALNALSTLEILRLSICFSSESSVQKENKKSVLKQMTIWSFEIMHNFI